MGLFGWKGGKWEDKKWWEDGKVGGQKRFYFLSFLFGWEWKSEGMEKISLNKFLHIPLLKNNTKLKIKKLKKNDK